MLVDLITLTLPCRLTFLHSPFEPLFESIYIPTLNYFQKQSHIRKKAKYYRVPFTIPYESFLGSMLGTSFRIKGVVGEDSYGMIYDVDDIYSSITYTAKEYYLASSSKNDRMYKARNIRRRQKWPTYMGCVEQSGKKFLIFQRTTVDVQNKSLEQPTKCTFDQYSMTFNADFPELPRRPSPALNGGYAGNKNLRAHQKKIMVANSVNSARSWADVIQMPAPVQKRKEKTWNQVERKKTRQRERRQRKRAERAKSKVSVFQT